MAFTFDASLSEARDRVRLRLGDTVDDGHELEDETIDSVLARHDEREGTAVLAEALAARYARMASDWTDGDAREAYTKRAEQMSEIAKAVRNGPNVDQPVNLDLTLGPGATGRLSSPDLTQFRTD